jgi:hypothetical protein
MDSEKTLCYRASDSSDRFLDEHWSGIAKPFDARLQGTQSLGKSFNLWALPKCSFGLGLLECFRQRKRSPLWGAKQTLVTRRMRSQF